MAQVCKAVEVAVFESNLKKAKAILANNPCHLEYLCEFRDHTELFVQYKINYIKGSMMRFGSQFSESNHANIVARLGCG